MPKAQTNTAVCPQTSLGMYLISKKKSKEYSPCRAHPEVRMLINLYTKLIKGYHLCTDFHKSSSVGGWRELDSLQEQTWKVWTISPLNSAIHLFLELGECSPGPTHNITQVSSAWHQLGLNSNRSILPTLSMYEFSFLCEDYQELETNWKQGLFYLETSDWIFMWSRKLYNWNYTIQWKNAVRDGGCHLS